MDNSNNLNNNVPNFQRSTWKQVQEENTDDWKMFFDCDPKDKPITSTNSAKPNKIEQQVKLVNYNSKKSIILGSVVMSPSGIGRLIKQDKNISSIKLIKTNEDLNFEDEEILVYFPVYIRIIDKDFSNWHKVSLPANGSVANIRKTLEERKIVEKDKTFTLIFNGVELKEETFFDQLDLRPDSKILLFGLRNSLCKVTRFNTINQWWYTHQTDGITFSVNKNIRLSGVGLYGSHEGKIQSGSVTVHEGNSKVGIPIYEELVEIAASPNQAEAVVPVNFKKPISIKHGLDYTIQFISTNNCYFYYGGGGLAKVVGEKKIEFDFKFTSSNGSSVESGNFPELYYYA